MIIVIKRLGASFAIIVAEDDKTAVKTSVSFLRIVSGIVSIADAILGGNSVIKSENLAFISPNISLKVVRYVGAAEIKLLALL